MRWMRWSAATLIVSSAVIGLACTTVTPTKQASTEDKIARGQYLVTIGSCGDCHTPGTLYGGPDMGRQLAGSEIGWEGPWGVVYARNLTPHENGLASWTEEQIVTAIRTGARPDGRQLAPIMPWMNLASLTDEDAAAIAAYLKSIPPVDHKVPDIVPAGATPAGPVIRFPPPTPWDTPPAGASHEGHGHGADSAQAGH